MRKYHNKCFICENAEGAYYRVNDIKINVDRTRRICSECYNKLKLFFPKRMPACIPEHQEIRFATRLIEGRKDERQT